MRKPRVRTAPHGKKGITIGITLWTNDMTPNKGEILTGCAWPAGYVRVETNPFHDIGPQEHENFNSLAELPLAVERALRKADVLLAVPNAGMLPSWDDPKDKDYLVTRLALTREPICERCHCPKSTASHLSRVPTGQHAPAGSPAAKHTVLCPGDQYGPHTA